MKSPLAAIKLHAQTLQEREGITPDAQRMSLSFIVQQADRMVSLVDNVLESSRLLSSRRAPELKRVHLAAFFGPYFESARPHAEASGVTLKTDVRTASDALSTEEALRRVMDNLIANAVRFSTKGGEVRCRVTDDEGTASVRIEVEDDGAGIPNKELPHIFDRFYQAGPRTDAHRRGTGLGLSIVAGLVREMHGTVRAFSQEGRPGSRFVIEIPALPAEPTR
jgi:signal transduction histidine kinase